jgi:hypothetical protein
MKMMLKDCLRIILFKKLSENSKILTLNINNHMGQFGSLLKLEIQMKLIQVLLIKIISIICLAPILIG